MFERTFGRSDGQRWFINPQGFLQDMEHLQSEMARMVQGFRRPTAPAFPALNLWVNEDRAILSAELPGMGPDDIELHVMGRTLNLRGTRKSEQPQGDCLRCERVLGDFSRAVELPFEIDSTKIDAAFARGVLTVTLPRAEADKPRRIKVTAGE